MGGVEIKGDPFGKLRRALNESSLGKDLDVDKLGRDVLSTSQGLVPVRTGYLKSTGYTYVLSGYNKITLTIGYTASYAVYVEYGVGKVFINGQANFLRDAVSIESDNLISELGRNFKNRINKA